MKCRRRPSGQLLRLARQVPALVDVCVCSVKQTENKRKTDTLGRDLMRWEVKKKPSSKRSTGALTPLARAKKLKAPKDVIGHGVPASIYRRNVRKEKIIVLLVRSSIPAITFTRHGERQDIRPDLTASQTPVITSKRERNHHHTPAHTHPSTDPPTPHRVP